MAKQRLDLYINSTKGCRLSLCSLSNFILSMKNILIIIFSSLSTLLTAQTLKVEYNEVISYIPEIVNNHLGILMVAPNESHYRTIFKDMNSEIEEDEETLVVPIKQSDYFSEIYIDKKTKILTENLFERYALKKFYAVSEKVPTMKWKLFNTEKKISNYLCKKARTTFRGRIYDVWYTEAIPISIGPWKFSGLPGLILAVEDQEGIFKWNVKSITYPYKGKMDFDEVKARMKKFNKITFKDLDANIIEGQKDKYLAMKTRNGTRSQSVKFGFSTAQWREPSNEFRQQKEFQF